jgi:hypothetical protein
MIAIEHDLAFRSARQFETVDKWVSRIDISFARVTAASVAEVAKSAIEIAYVYQRHLDIADVIVAIPISRIEIHSAPPLQKIAVSSAARDGCAGVKKRIRQSAL